jgi:hypothetical protein
VSNESEVEVAVISSSMANYIQEVMHSLRRTMPMTTYLTFLIDSCGMRHVNNNSSTMKQTAELSECVFSYDNAVAQLSRFLISSCDLASTKVLPMISPILHTWLAAPDSTSNDVLIKQIVQARAAISLIAAFTWDEVLSNNSTQSDSDFIAPEFLKLDEKFDGLLVDCIISQFELSARLWSVGGGHLDDSQQHQYLARLLGPITLILRYRHGIFGHFVSRRVVQVNNTKEEQEEGKESHVRDEFNVMEQQPGETVNVEEVHMKALLLVLKSKDPASMADLVRSSNELQSTLLSSTKDIEKSVSGGHLAHLGSKLLHQAELLCK